MPLMISDPRTRIALQLGLAISAQEDAIAAREDVERHMGDALERAYRHILATGTRDEFAKLCPDFARWLAMQPEQACREPER